MMLRLSACLCVCVCAAQRHHFFFSIANFFRTWLQSHDDAAAGAHNVRPHLVHIVRVRMADTRERAPKRPRDEEVKSEDGDVERNTSNKVARTRPRAQFCSRNLWQQAYLQCANEMLLHLFECTHVQGWQMRRRGLFMHPLSDDPLRLSRQQLDAALAAADAAAHTDILAFAKARGRVHAHGADDAITGNADGAFAQSVRHVAAEEGDDVFLAVLQSSGRSYRAGCAICLTDKMMGTTCSCGHTEIAVFRPCGHSMCIAPCFTQFMASRDIALGVMRQQLSDGTWLTYSNKVGVSDVSGFPCPLCRTDVAHCFRAEETCITSEVFLEALDIDGAIEKMKAAAAAAAASAM